MAHVGVGGSSEDFVRSAEHVGSTGQDSVISARQHFVGSEEPNVSARFKSVHEHTSSITSRRIGTPSCDGGTPGTSFEYNIATSTSSTSACAVPNPSSSTKVWAQSYLSKYVVEFYTDKELLTPWTPTAGWFTYNQTGRIYRGGVIDTGVFRNPDEKGNGAYKAYFESTGVKTGSGCNSCTINNTI